MTIAITNPLHRQRRSSPSANEVRRTRLTLSLINSLNSTSALLLTRQYMAAPQVSPVLLTVRNIIRSSRDRSAGFVRFARLVLQRAELGCSLLNGRKLCMFFALNPAAYFTLRISDTVQLLCGGALYPSKSRLMSYPHMRSKE